MPLHTAALAQRLTQQALLSAGQPAAASSVRRPFAVLSTAALADLHRFAAQMRQLRTVERLPEAPTRARATILSRAQSMLGMPYRWGGNGPDGLDCSAFVSRAWGISRHTTDTLPQVAREISKEELQPGDALNLPTWRDGKRFGHVRLFAGWANAEHTLMEVYEAASPPGRVVRHVIPYDPAYTPLRLATLAAAER